MTELKQQLINSIREWIHMDNLVENLSVQAANARQLRAKHEAGAISLMKQMNLSASTIKVSGAALNIQKKAVPSGLTWGFLEKEVDAWTAAGQKTPLIRWLHDRREIKETEILRKVKTG